MFISALKRYDSRNKSTINRSLFEQLKRNGVLPKWNRNSANSGNLIDHVNMNSSQLKDPVSHICPASAVVASWSLTQDVAGWQV